MMTEEQYLMRQISLIEDEYRKAAQPYVDRLIYLKRISIEPIFVAASEIPPVILESLKKQEA